MSQTPRLTAVMLWFCVAFAPVSAEPQTVTTTAGAINGTVTDSTGAIVPGVTVTLSGPSLIATRTSVTDGAGLYRFSAVSPGDVTLTFELAGFNTVVREPINVSLGFTATVNGQLNAAPVADTVTVIGSPVVDVSSTAVTTHFDNTKLVSLPGSRDVFSLLALTPGVALAKMDVGGSGALALQEYTAYGLRAGTGINRNEVEGIRVGGANGANDNYFSDFASFSEIAITAVGQSATMSVPGTLGQYISKSGGNTYHGSAYLDFQNDVLEATNIDGEQIARGLAGSPGFDPRDSNRLQLFHDFNADLGGYAKKEKAWWYGAYRSTSVSQRYPWLLDAATTLGVVVGTGKLTYRLSPRHTLVGYLQHERFTQANYFATGSSQPLQTSDALPGIVFPVTVWKTEYNAAVSDALFAEVRAGAYRSDALIAAKSSEPRIADIGANTVSGGAAGSDRQVNRPQINGSVSFSKAGWTGSHTVKVGGEYLVDRVVTASAGYLSGCNCVSTLNNGAPTQVQIQLGANVSRNELTTAAALIDDTWRPNSRVTLLLGLRVDRYRPILPEQQGPAGQPFPAIDPVLTFTNWGPRVGLTTDLTGDGKTVLKLHYGTFWVYPAPLFTAALNPNPPGWSRTYLWTNDANHNGRWDPGEEGALTSVAGGTASTRLDPGIANTLVRQASAYVERYAGGGIAVRTGVVVNARRQPFGTINVSRPLDAYSTPITVVDPGPDGRLGSADDGASVTAYNLSPAALATPPVNLTTVLPDSHSEYYTWEATATRRQSGRWSLLASVAETWSHEAALGSGADFTPNALINSTGDQDRFTTWQAKIAGTVRMPLGFRLVPVFRHQSGQPFARTFVRTLNYGNATIKAEPVAANRTPNVSVLDLRTEKAFPIRSARVVGFIDAYNLLNTNAAQTLTTSSGGFWLRPTAITGPRVVRIGARADW